MTNTIMPLSEQMSDQCSYWDSLSGLVHSPECLSSKGYITALLSDTDLEKKKRCCKCNLVLVKGEKRPRQRSVRKQDPPGALPSQVPDEINSLGLEHLQLEEPRGPTLRCHFHNGKTVNKVTLLTIPVEIRLTDYYDRHGHVVARMCQGLLASTKSITSLNDLP
jgi:hypothetical protein